MRRIPSGAPWESLIGWRLVATPVALGALLAGCSSEGGQPPDRAQGSVYFVSGAPGWALKQAVKPRPDDPVIARAEPTLDW